MITDNDSFPPLPQPHPFPLPSCILSPFPLSSFLHLFRHLAPPQLVSRLTCPLHPPHPPLSLKFSRWRPNLRTSPSASQNWLSTRNLHKFTEMLVIYEALTCAFMRAFKAFYSIMKKSLLGPAAILYFPNWISNKKRLLSKLFHTVSSQWRLFELEAHKNSLQPSPKYDLKIVLRPHFSVTMKRIRIKCYYFRPLENTWQSLSFYFSTWAFTLFCEFSLFSFHSPLPRKFSFFSFWLKLCFKITFVFFIVLFFY